MHAVIFIVKWSAFNIFFSSGGAPPPEKMPRHLEMVGAAAGHMATRVPKPYDSDGRHSEAAPVSTANELLNSMIPEGPDCSFDESPGINTSGLV